MTPSVVDWTVALSTARKLVKPGPQVTAAGAAEVVADLRAAAVRAEAYVVEVTGLPVPPATAPVLVVDRPGWIQANLDGFRETLAPLDAKLREKLSHNPAMSAIGSRVTGAEIGLLLSYLAPKVLGQFDPFFPGAPGEPGGRLLLVAPNVVAVERELKVDPADFRLWVCLHEVTHQLQFTGVPWLKGHLESEIAEFVDATDLNADVLRERLQEVLRGVVDAVRGSDENAEGLMALIKDPAQRAVLDRVTAVMSLVEGHAEYVMDGVGPDVVPTVKTLRKRFAQRRKGRGPLDRVLRRLLGLEQKMKQYAEG
ncbi:MAG: zinc-dependent metalloprotease, partial [Friedmanniella sp.]